MIEQMCLDLLRELSTDENSHSGRTLFEHLKGTHDLLEKWGNSRDVCVGGLFHSIYGTEYYKVQSADVADRKRIADVIGPRAEELAFLFCTSDRVGFFKEADKHDPVLINRATKEHIPVSAATLGALIEIEVANYMEQFRAATASPKLIEFMRYMLKAGNDHMTTLSKEEFARLLEHVD